MTRTRQLTGLRARGNAWEAFVYDRRAKKKIRRTFPTLAEARAWRHDAATAVRKGTLRPSTGKTVQTAWAEWLEGAEAGAILSRNREQYKPSTLRGYRRDMARYLLPELGAYRLADVRPDDVQAIVERLNGQGLSGSRVRNLLVPLQSLYRRHRREVPSNPTEGLDLPPAGGRRERAVSPEEAAALLDALDEADRPLWATAFYAGLRRGELRALRVSDVNFPEATTITVEWAWDDVEGDIAPKSHKGRRVVPVASALRVYLLEQKLRTRRRGDERLFGPFRPHSVQARADAAWAAAGLQRLTLHECRHSYVSLMHAAGCSLEEIGDFVGHSSAYMVDRYRHLLDSQRDRAAERLDQFLAGAGTGANRPRAASLSQLHAPS
jgi:integrase